MSFSMDVYKRQQIQSYVKQLIDVTKSWNCSDVTYTTAVSYTHLDVYKRQIGSRIKQRRLELNLTQPYVAEKMGVTASTILRYENGSIDNTKKMVLEGLSEALHVSVEWLKGETDEYETDITDKSCLLYTSRCV